MHFFVQEANQQIDKMKERKKPIIVTRTPPPRLPHKNQSDAPLEPPEGGWGWMVALGMSVMFVTTTGQYGSFGLLFEDILEKLGQETTGAALVINTLTTAINFTGLATNYLLRSLSYRKVAIIGGLLFSTGITLTFFAQSMLHILASYSVLAGIGLGLIVSASFTAFNSYFLKRRGVAMGLSQAVIGVGFILAPILVKNLLDYYGFRGTILVLAGISLNSVVGAALYQPIEWHATPKKQETEDSIFSRRSSRQNGEGSIQHTGPMHVIELKKMESIIEEVARNGEKEDEEMVSHRLLDQEEMKRNLSHSRLSYHRQSSVNFSSGVLMFDNALAEHLKQVAETAHKQRCRWTFWEKIVDFFGLQFLKDPSYVNIALGISFSFLSDTNFFAIYPFFLSSIGFSRGDMALCMSLTAGMDVLSRLAIPLAAERLQLRKRTVYLLGCFTSAIARSVLVLFDDLQTIAIVSGVCGFLRGGMIVNQSLTIAEHCSLENFPAAYGLYMVINGIITLTLGPLVGVIRDYTQSFPFCIHVLSGLLMLCALTWMLEYFIVWRRTNASDK